MPRITNSLTMDRRFEIQMLIRANGCRVDPAGIPDDKGKYWRYSESWDDGRVARELAVPRDAVANTRQGTFGRLYRQKEDPVVPAANTGRPLLDQFTALKAEVQNLHESHTALSEEVVHLKYRVRELEVNFTPTGGSATRNAKGNAGAETPPYSDPEQH